MEEQSITFETAKLAKEKGFDFRTPDVWADYTGGVKCRKVNLTLKLTDNEYNAPTQSLLQKWLREKHDAYINITPVTMVGIVVYYKAEVAVPSMVWDEPIKIKEGKYEEVLEQCLQEVLKLI